LAALNMISTLNHNGVPS